MYTVALIVLHTNVDAQCDKLATVVGRTKSTTLATVDVLHGHVSFMRHLKKYADAQTVTPNMRRKYGTELLETNYPISFHRGPDTWMVSLCWQSDGRGNKT